MDSEQLIRKTKWFEKSYLGVRGYYESKPVHLYGTATGNRYSLLYGSCSYDIPSKLAESALNDIRNNVEEIYTESDSVYTIGNKELTSTKNYLPFLITGLCLVFIAIGAIVTKFLAYFAEKF